MGRTGTPLEAPTAGNNNPLKSLGLLIKKRGISFLNKKWENLLHRFEAVVKLEKRRDVPSMLKSEQFPFLYKSSKREN